MRELLRLTKPGICVMISMTAVVGYFMASGETIDKHHFAVTIIATYLLASGSAALNQILERRHDALMARTKGRPLPSGAISLMQAVSTTVVLSVTGLALSSALLPPITTVLLVVCYITYGLLYTPLKRLTPACTLVGGIPGALPVLAGWSATGAGFTPTAVALVAVMFLWQMPHFLSIGWLAREDYARAGFRILSVVDTDGASSGRISQLYALLLIPTSLVPAFMGSAQLAYALIAAVAGSVFLWNSHRFAMTRSRHAARTLFFTSLAYLPALFGGLVIFTAP